ncbi:hypothetical protein BD626DRAFT_539915 [Schizophyllum amplum]|uniref:Uncharacterized protein n=1 Tax=Schizophyllum amplum TaxID=97359 RepID=A0A550C1L0_9AGAR|nr:hypothetical protein BD626DRAFT_539915 [Auriculariopsis ampla]
MESIILHPAKGVNTFAKVQNYATPGPYERTPSLACSHVPTLVHFCIRRLVDFPDQIGRVCILYVPPETEGDSDVLRTLIPSYSYQKNTFDKTTLDPRLWAVLVQLFDRLPSVFSTCWLALNDKHLLTLQRIECSDRFTLIVILDLSGSTNLTDDTVHKLFGLRHLSALDMSNTSVSALAVKLLRPRLNPVDDSQGPRALRVLCLENCRAVSDPVYEYLHLFPLLCLVDLRGTKCSGHLPDQPAMYSSKNVYTLMVAQERYPSRHAWQDQDPKSGSDTDDVARDHFNVLSRVSSHSDVGGDPSNLSRKEEADTANLPSRDAYDPDVRKADDDVFVAPGVVEDAREFASRLHARQFYGGASASSLQRPPPFSSSHNRTDKTAPDTFENMRVDPRTLSSRKDAVAMSAQGFLASRKRARLGVERQTCLASTTKKPNPFAKRIGLTSSNQATPSAVPVKPLVPISAIPRPEFPKDDTTRSASEKGKLKAGIPKKSSGKKDLQTPRPTNQFDWGSWSKRGR